MFTLTELSPRVHNALAATKSDVNTLRTGLTSITNSLFNIKAEILDADSLQVCELRPVSRSDLALPSVYVSNFIYIADYKMMSFFYSGW